MRRIKVGIVGAGPGGLMTAYLLQKQANEPLAVELFEASDRVGGKIWTPRFQSRHACYEAGAAEFYDYSPVDEDPLKELIAELGLSIVPMGGSSVILDDRVIDTIDDVCDRYGSDTCRALREFDRQAKSRITPREFYWSDGVPVTLNDPTSNESALKASAADETVTRFSAVVESIIDPVTRRYLQTMIHSDLATEPSRTSVTYGLQNYLMNDPAYMRLYGIAGGNEQLPQSLAARLAAQIHLRQPVISISRVGEQYRIQSKPLPLQSTSPIDSVPVDSVPVDADGTCSELYDYVVIALPHDQLKSINYEGDRLAVAMKAHHEFYHHPAHYLRITLLFSRPFWRHALRDSYCMLDRFGGCCLYDESSREPESKHGILGWLVGGENACEMSRWSDDALIDAAIESLPSFMPGARETFLEGRVHRWIGAVNAIPGGLSPRSLDLRHCPEPMEHSKLFVVGDYLFDSTLNGVLDSADYVAAWIAASLADHS